MSVPSNQDAAGDMPGSAAGADPRLPLRSAQPDEAPVTDPKHLLPEHASESGGPHKASHRRMVVLAIVALLIIGFVLWRVHASHVAAQQAAAQQLAAAERPTPVQVAPVQLETVPVFLTALGTVTAYNTVTLHTRVDGQLLQVNFREGQNVTKGQLLLEIDPRPYQAALDQAIGTLAKDEANLKDEQAEAERYTALYEAGVVSKEQQQQYISNQDQAVGSIKADQAAIEAARVNLGYTHIYSPINGVVGLRQVDPGNIVNTTDTTGLVVITQIHPIAIIFTLPEDQLPQVQQAMKGKKLVVEAYDRADSHKIATGTLLTLDNQIDTTTGTAKVKAVFDNANSMLFPNEFVNIRLILSQRPNSIVVPTAAVESGTQGDYVFLVDPGPTPADKIKNLPGETPANATTGATTAPAPAPKKSSGKGKNGQKQAQYHADIVPVHVAFTIGINSVLDSGAVKPGQQVVVDGQEKLVDGGNVTPQEAKTIPASNGSSAIGGSASSTTTSPQQPASSSGTTPSGTSQTGQNAGQSASPSSTSTGGAH